MKKFSKIIIFLAVFCLGIGSGYAFSAEKDREMLVGAIGATDLQKGIYEKWYRRNYDSYQGDGEVLSALPPLLSDIRIRIVLGTWCHDSQRQVPRFLKILEALKVDMGQIELIAVDKEFTAPEHDLDALHITNTPTFIFYRGGQEINRIVETPVNSLEKDMAIILKDEKYRHSKMK